MSRLNIVEEFPDYKYPGPRYRSLGLQSGQEFREKHFLPWLQQHLDDEIILNVDGFAAYPPSFFKEFILGAAAEKKEYKAALQKAKIECQSDEFRSRIEKIIKEIV